MGKREVREPGPLVADTGPGPDGDTGPAPDGDAGLGTTAVRGATWQLLSALLTKVLTTASFVVLARLLEPRAFGLVALASAFVLILQYFVGSGFAQALVQRKDVDHEDLDTLFFASIGVGLLFAGLLAAVSPWLGGAFSQPRLPAVLCALSVSFLFTGLESVPLAVLQRGLAFRTMALRRFFATLSSSVLGVGLALAGAGVWALVGQTIAFSAASAATTWSATDYRPGRGFSWSRLRSALGFSQKVTATNVLVFAGRRADDLLVGALLGPVALGYYSIAYRILLLLLDTTNGAMAAVAFPTFSKLQGQPVRLARAYRSASRVSALFNVPVFLLTAAVAPDIVQLAFGDRWAPASPVLQLLCVFGALQTLQQFQGAVLTSLGRPGTVLTVQLVQTVVQIAMFVVAAQHSIQWVAASLVVRSVVFLPLLPRIVARELGVPSLPMFYERLRPAVLATATAGAVAWLRQASPVVDLPVAARLVLLGLLGAVTYLVLLRLLAPAALEEAMAYAARLTRRKRARRATGGGGPAPARDRRRTRRAATAPYRRAAHARRKG